ncbi:MAG: MBL fold metallo-hydrolase [Chitinivibrionales bacterium]|nr:MBL fold metallo-hydrolase [Chitinivibrionales bacterium]
MNMKVLFDKDTQESDYRTGWGISFLINETVLFDASENGEWLLHNMQAMNVDIDAIDSVVISHDHWDHTGGLGSFLEKKPSCTVYGCSGFSDRFRQNVRKYGTNLIEPAGSTHIAENIFVSGEIIGTYKNAPISEQALVIQGNDGISVVTGCAHPGITTMIRTIADSFQQKEIALAAGGFHCMQKETHEITGIINELHDLGVCKVGPTHCSGNEAQRLFKDAWGDNYVSFRVGESITI